MEQSPNGEGPPIDPSNTIDVYDAYWYLAKVKGLENVVPPPGKHRCDTNHDWLGGGEITNDQTGTQEG